MTSPSFKDMPRQRIIAWSILVAMFLYAIVVLLLSTGTFDNGDGLMHYFISRYSWHHHRLFIDDWGKPVFTIISSPFAQFGLKGITIFNILCGIAASYCAYRIAEKLRIPFPYLAIIFTFSAPIYFSAINSGLTEPLFSLVIIACIWLIMEERYYLSAILFSFLPFIRAEFVFVLPVFVFYYVLKKKYLVNLLLPFGTIVISIIGAFYYGNIHWLIQENPYSTKNAQVYGAVRGDMLTYISHFRGITGHAMVMLVIMGILWFAGFRYFKKAYKAEETNEYYLEEILLVFGCFVNILMGHTIVWATGIFPTLGLLRYMAPLIPLASIIALRGLQVINLVPDMMKMPKMKNVIAGIFVAGVLVSPYLLWYKVPFRMGGEEAITKKAVDWLKTTPDANKKVYYLAPYVTVCLNIDPFDYKRRGELWSMSPQHPDSIMAQGDIMIWDSHFGPNEGKLKLDSLLKNPNLTLLQLFDSDESTIIIGGGDHQIWIFRRK